MTKRISPSTVVDLTLDSDEVQDARLSDVTKRLYSNNSAEDNTKRAKTVRTTSSDFEANVIGEVLVQDNDAKPAAIPSSETAIEPMEADQEVEVVEASKAPIAGPVATLAFNEGNYDEELQVVGTRNELKLPHLRHRCEVHPFAVKAANSDQLRIQNELYCELCYCYVCDVPVKDCKSWSNVDGIWRNSHCNATDKHNWWVKEREAAKGGNGGTFAMGIGGQNTLPAPARPYPHRLPVIETAIRTAYSLAARGVTGSSHRLNLTDLFSNIRHENPEGECTHCGSHNSTHRVLMYHMDLDCGRCFTCGRLTLPPKQHTHYEPAGGIVGYNFGERQIGFRIVAKDVRHDEKYSESWQKADKNDPRWQYSEAAMKQSVFDFKVGRLPSLKVIMNLVSEWMEEKVREKNIDAIILDNQGDIALLRLLHRVGIGSHKPEGHSASLYGGDITASWDTTTATGTFKIRLFLPRNYLYRSEHHALLLGCWFHIFPVELEKISGTLKASSPEQDEDFKEFFHGLAPAVRDAVEAAVSSHNKKADEFRSSLTLASGCSNEDIGGYMSNDLSLRGILESFYKEQFSHSTFASLLFEESDDWNKLSNHHQDKKYHSSDHDFVLSYSDRRFAAMCLWYSARAVGGYSTQDMLAHLEDLGHEPELTCEGLTVELLEFQKQSLRWAMERETTPGGIQSYFWVKVPIEDSTLFFNPVLGRFREDKPKRVRGGIIAEEMGLGKTIISLALILKHPAPALPISGSHISCLANEPIASEDGSESNVLQWDLDLYSQTSTDNKLRGSVLSRATLVVCPVSLVGQWIEEAKSKLSNPGLLYPYHGDNRIRDAKKLAKNAIVVTTYQVLASDASHHRKKSPNPDEYCPPLEQVRWWRIICDESHCLRKGSTQRHGSLSKLVADNKWMVTGTTVSTSMLDLKSQLKLIGVEDVDCMFYRPHARRKESNLAPPGNLRFLLRNIMIRHTQKQVYRGTNTTLMSLPPKNERSIEITLSDTERKEYDALDKTAKDFYVKFKASHSDELSQHYLLLSHKLNPQRVACSGVHRLLIPEAGKGEEDDDTDGETKSRKKKEVKLSDFCFTSKSMALIEELKRAQDLDPTSKSLVFSHFNTTLDWLKKELPNHGFQLRTLSGSMTMKQRAKALHDFQADPPTTIFLLSMRAGNCGINLTQANRVFLMEPGFNPALEKQAIGRVHRLGQKRNVEIIRLLVKDSIETRICKFLETKYGIDGHGSKEGSEKEQKESKSDKTESEVFKVVGNLASERPKNAMITSEFDLLFGVESKSEVVDSAIPDVAMPDAAVSSDFL